MSDLSDTVGSDLPSLSADQEAAFAAEEAAANQARADAKGGGHQRIPSQGGDEEGEPEPAPKPAAPAAAPTPAPAAPAAAQPAPAPAAPAVTGDDEVPDAVVDKDGNRYVPVATLVSTRKGLQGQLRDLEASQAELKKQNDLLMRIAEGKVVPAAPAPAPVPEPAPEVNPFDKTTHPLEHLEWNNQQLEKRIAAREAADKEFRTQTERQGAFAAAQRAYQQSHHAFVAANPQYADAYGFVMKTMVAANKAIGMSDAEAVQAAENAEWNVVQRAVASNQAPSAMLWQLAKASGWQPPAAQPAAAPGAPTPAPAPTPAKQIELAQAGAAAAISLSDAAGGSAPQPLTLATVATMDKDEFNAKFSGAAGEELFRKMAMGPTRRSAVA